MSNDDSTDDQVAMQAKEDSSLTLPLTIIGVTLLVSAGFLYYYFGPSYNELTGNVADPSASKSPVSVSVEGHDFRIPANHMRYPKDRRGGTRDRVALYALLPRFEPFSPGKKEVFETERIDSPIIYFEISGHQFALDEKGRFERLYKEHIVDLAGSQGPDGLTRYEFDGTTGYKDEDLFALGIDSDQPVLIRCYRETATIPMPDCRRDDVRISDDLAVSYRFKRHWLADWRTIDKDIMDNITAWKTAPLKPAAPAGDPADDQAEG